MVEGANVRPCNFDKQGNKNQCFNCVHNKRMHYMRVYCGELDVNVEYDDICDRFKLQ